MRVAHFVHRYPPALGGSEAYFARLSHYLRNAGDNVTVLTTTALDLEAFWSPHGRCLPPGVSVEDGVEVRRCAPWHFPGLRWAMRGLSLLPVPALQRLMLPCNPLTPGMWRDAGRLDRPFDIVRATAFPAGCWRAGCVWRDGCAYRSS
jgi:hypothetical protein